MSNKDDKSSSDIKKMSTLLLSGATMLTDSCPDCNVPLFKKGEKIFCPNCGRRAVFVRSDEEIKQVEHAHLFSETKETVQDIITGKLNFLAQKLAASEDFEEIKTVAQIMDLLLDLSIKISKAQ